MKQAKHEFYISVALHYVDVLSHVETHSCGLLMGECANCAKTSHSFRFWETKRLNALESISVPHSAFIEGLCVQGLNNSSTLLANEASEQGLQ